MNEFYAFDKIGIGKHDFLGSFIEDRDKDPVFKTYYRRLLSIWAREDRMVSKKGSYSIDLDPVF